MTHAEDERFWNEVDTTFDAVEAELHRQTAKWGPQSHLDGTGDHVGILNATFPTVAAQLKQFNDERQASSPDRSVWITILLEEVFEAAAATTTEELETELVQTIAVATNWLADLRSREHNGIRDDIPKPSAEEREKLVPKPEPASEALLLPASISEALTRPVDHWTVTESPAGLRAQSTVDPLRIQPKIDEQNWARAKLDAIKDEVGRHRAPDPVPVPVIPGPGPGQEDLPAADTPQQWLSNEAWAAVTDSSPDAEPWGDILRNTGEYPLLTRPVPPEGEQPSCGGTGG